LGTVLSWGNLCTVFVIESLQHIAVRINLRQKALNSVVIKPVETKDQKIGVSATACVVMSWKGLNIQ
jgi:hypothetical protein